MPGWRGLLRAALALLVAPAIWALVWVIGLWAATLGSSTDVAIVSPGIYPALLVAELVTLAPVLALLLALRRLTLPRLMLWSGLAMGLVFLAWLQVVSLGPPLVHWTTAFQTAVAVLFGFLNAGLFGLLAGVRRWPASRNPARQRPDQ